MTKILQTLYKYIFVIVLTAFLGFGLASTPTRAATCPETLREDPAAFNSPDCVAERLGLKEVDNKSVFVKQNPVYFIANIFMFLIAIVIFIVVARIVFAGITIANAKEDPEQRTEGFKKALNAIIGLIVALSSLGITTIIQNTFGGEINPELFKDCEALVDYPEEVIQRCRELTTDEVVPTINPPPSNEGRR
jgi:hypothetical protein